MIILFLTSKTPKPNTETTGSSLIRFNQDIKNYNVKLQIFNNNDIKINEFDTALVDDDEKRGYGLMNLDFLPKNQAMLFLFDENEIIYMWMKNTRISLDMLFIDTNNEIISIKRNATPYSLDIISSEKPVVKVLEINGGLSKNLGIEIGNKIKTISQQ